MQDAIECNETTPACYICHYYTMPYGAAAREFKRFNIVGPESAFTYVYGSTHPLYSWHQAYTCYSGFVFVKRQTT